MLRIIYLTVAFITSARVVVAGWSMYPALAPGEYVLFNRLAYIWCSPEKGDVVLARGVSGVEMAVIKRVVGLPGDTVRITRGVVTVNGMPVQGDTSTDEPDCDDGLWTVDEGKLFLLGDAMDMSTDSRSYGPVHRKAIGARAWLVYWPISRRRSIGTH